MARPNITEQFDPEQIYQIIEEYLSVVGRRQYIGQRYVPIFGRVGEYSIEWDNTAPYEPLTIVLYQGNSYTSRQYVPTGIEITNEEFWACTGNYNAQVEAYRRETARIAELYNELSASLPAESFSEDSTVKDYIDDSIESSESEIRLEIADSIASLANDVYGGPTNLYVNANDGNDSNDGTESNPVATIAKAFEIISSKNKHDTYIYINGEGEYELPRRIVGIQCHVMCTSENVTLNVDVPYAYQNYLHIAGDTAHQLNVVIKELHQDVGALYFRYCNIDLKHTNCSWCGITFADCVIDSNTSGQNNSLLNCDVIISSCTWRNNIVSGGYWRQTNGTFKILGSGFIIGGNTQRTSPFFYLENTLYNIAISNITGEDDYQAATYLINSQFSWGILSNSANNAINNVLTSALTGVGVYAVPSSNNTLIRVQ